MKYNSQQHRIKKLALIVGLVMGMSACGSDDDDPAPPETPPANNAPVISSTAVLTVEEGQDYSYTLAATDADGDTLTLAATSLPAWLSFEASTGVLSGTPSEDDVGDHAVTLTVSDGTDTQTQSFTVEVTAIPNVAPLITSVAPTAATEGSEYSYTLTATDEDGDTLTMSATTSPDWLTFVASTGVLSGTPATADVGDHDVELSVSDGEDSVSQNFTITVAAVVSENNAPVITSNAITMATVGTSYTYTLTATDEDGDDLTYSSVTLPTWGAFDTSTGILSGTPDAADSYPVELSVSDGTDSVSDAFTIVVTEASAPVLTIFENTALPAWAAWDCCGGTTPTIETDDAEHDQVTEFVINGGTVVGFTAREADGAVGGMPFDASAIAADGTLSFELKMTQLPTGGQVDWLLKVESDGAATNGEVSLSSSQEGHEAPVLDTWLTYTFNIADLATAGLDVSAIDLVMVFPAFGPGDGAIFRIDNVKVFPDGANTVEPPPPADSDLVIFENAIVPAWAPWDCCGGSTITIETDDAEHDQVTEFTIIGGTVVGYTARDADGAVDGQPFNASAIADEGVITFDLKLVQQATAGPTNWLLKVESNAAATFAEVNLSSSQEGHAAPVLDTWQTYTFNISDLADAGLDVNLIDLFMVFPAFGPGDGAIFRIDNFKVLSTGAVETPVNTQLNIDFEEGGAGNAGYVWAVFENGDNPALEIIANPDSSGVNDSATVAKFTARVDGQPFAGTETSSGPTFTLDSSNKIVRIMVWKSVISDVGIKFSVGAAAQPELKVANTQINQWEELTFDFSSYIGTAETVNITNVIVFPDFNARDAETVNYFDNITFSAN
ncbi:putative Ig domain-containing protein [Glaciecola sp. MF2-115]|uniref:putative Ig domain-containing protein n=1 Tax=Glaciecola sp. MF2-115 TaxID=3384827 RepID=UPI00399EEBA7